jgi:hypothetical protein
MIREMVRGNRISLSKPVPSSTKHVLLSGVAINFVTRKEIIWHECFAAKLKRTKRRSLQIFRTFVFRLVWNLFGREFTWTKSKFAAFSEKQLFIFENEIPKKVCFQLLEQFKRNTRVWDCLIYIQGFKSYGCTSDSRRNQIFWEVMGLELGPLSLVSTIEELLEKKSSGSGLEIREYGCGDPLRWQRNTVYQPKLALTSPTSGGRSACIVHARTNATEFSLPTLLMELLHVLTHNCQFWHTL